MGAVKRILCIIVSVIFCLTLFGAVVTAESGETDIYDMADALNRLNILQGENGDYMLDNNLDRAQATAFIIRMLGKEDHVRQNADQYRYTRFDDVDPNQWYAPYIGYGTQNGIIAGIDNYNFKPREKTTEKAFLKMALCALGYVYNEDFDWTNVFQKAYEVGIVTDDSYRYRVEDNNDYRRRDAVEVLYLSLNAYKKGTETRMATTLVDEGLFTMDELLDSGIFGEITPAEIESISAIAPNNVEIKLNRNIKDIFPQDVEVVEEDTGKALDIISLAYNYGYVQVITSGQIPGKPYKLTIKSFTDSNGVKAGPVSGVFKGYTPIQVVSDFFRIQKVEQTSLNVIDVYFTHPLNINSENPIYYELFSDGKLFAAGSSQNMTVKKLQSVPNAVSIYLKNGTFEPGQVYTLRVSGKLISGYGAYLAEGHGETIDFTTAIEQSEELSILAVEGKTSNTVRILFNREVDPVWAGKRLNYTVYNAYNDPVEVKQATVTDSGEYSGREVILTLASPLDKTKIYQLKIEYIPDLYRQSAIEDRTVQFSGSYTSNVDLALTGVTADYANYVELHFNKALDPADASDFTKYVIRSMTTSYMAVPKKAYYSAENGKFTVKLYLPSFQSLDRKENYVVYVSSLKDSLGTASSSLLRREFSPKSNNVIKPQVIDAVTVSRDLVRLLFNMETAFNPTNLSITNYVLEYEENGEVVRKAPISITYIDPVTLILRFDELDGSTEYRLWFDKVYDYSEEYIATSASTNVRWGR